MQILNGDVYQPGDVGEGPGKSSLFYLTAWRVPGIDLFGDRVRTSWQSPAPWRDPVRPRRPLKIRGRKTVLRLSVPITASGPQGDQPLVHRTM